MAAPGRAALILAGLGVAVMAASIWLALGQGDFSAEGAQLMASYWGRLTVIDVYVGLALFSGWVVFRERRRAVAAGWVAAFLALGNLATCVYVLVAATTCGRDPAAFWMGARRDDSG